MSRSLFIIGWQDKTGTQNDNAHSFYRLKGKWIWLCDPLLDSKMIHLVDLIEIVVFT